MYIRSLVPKPIPSFSMLHAEKWGMGLGKRLAYLYLKHKCVSLPKVCISRQRLASLYLHGSLVSTNLKLFASTVSEFCLVGLSKSYEPNTIGRVLNVSFNDCVLKACEAKF